MTPAELKEALIAAGWAMGSQSRYASTGCDWYAWARKREVIPKDISAFVSEESSDAASRARR